MSSKMKNGTKKVTVSLLRTFYAFFIFLTAYKFAAVLHYSLLSPLGERLLPLWIVGLLIGGESFLQMFLDVPAGHLIDRFGKKRMLAIGWIAFVAAGASLMHFSLFNYIMSIAFSIIGWLFLQPGTSAYMLAYAEKDSGGRFFALRDTFSSIGVVLASLSLPFVLMYAPPIIGTFLLAIFAIAIIALWVSPPDKPNLHTEPVLPAEPYHIHRTDLMKSIRALKRLNPASGMLTAYTCAGAIFYGAVWFVVPLMIASDVSQQFLGLGLGIFDLSVVMLGVLIGTIVDHSDKRVMVFYGLLLFTLMGMIIGSTLGPLFLLFGFLAAAGDEITGLSLWAWLHSLDKDHAHDGAVAGVIALSNDIGYSIGPVVAGFAFSAWGPSLTITACAIPLLLVWIVYAIKIHPQATFPLSLIEIPQMPMRRRHKS